VEADLASPVAYSLAILLFAPHCYWNWHSFEIYDALDRSIVLGSILRCMQLELTSALSFYSCIDSFLVVISLL
jgi:hypothetical protein